MTINNSNNWSIHGSGFTIYWLIYQPTWNRLPCCHSSGLTRAGNRFFRGNTIKPIVGTYGLPWLEREWEKKKVLLIMMMHDLFYFLKLWKFYIPMVSCDDEYCRCLFFVQRLDLFLLSKHRKQKVNCCLRAYSLGGEEQRDRKKWKNVWDFIDQHKK